jgi:hypothetical protein
MPPPILNLKLTLQNPATTYFNRGVALRRQDRNQNEAQVLIPGGFGPNQNEAMSACGYFERAQALNALLPDSAQYWYVRDAYADCRPRIVAQSNTNFLPQEEEGEAVTLRGRVTDVETKRGIATGARIETKGLRPVLAILPCACRPTDKTRPCSSP